MAVVLSPRRADVFGVADRIVVLREGKKVADKAITDSSPEEGNGLITGAIRVGLSHATQETGRAATDDVGGAYARGPTALVRKCSPRRPFWVTVAVIIFVR